MKLQIDEITKMDFEIGARTLKKSSRKMEVSLLDAAYLSSSLISLITQSVTLDESDTAVLDATIGVLMRIPNQHE
ncbi:hypothetical protein [Agaribacterium sp. ZY112]|uniref:hypothetical protein n=1 Tax=Agaribacterium sp. ZY112 TaxID=3233574 RepID=UPI0035233E89